MKPLIALIILLTWSDAQAQLPVTSRAFPGEPSKSYLPDATLLNSQKPGGNLSCSVTPVKPTLGLDFLFHSGYQVSFPLWGIQPNSTLTIVMRIKPERKRNRVVYYVQTYSVPKFERDSAGSVNLDGEFRLGEGRYHVDWLMRDEYGQYCNRSWDVETKVAGKDIPLAMGLEKDVIHPGKAALFRQDAMVDRPPVQGPLSIKVIVNFAPQRPEAAQLGREDIEGPVGILRQIGRDPRIGTISVVACSLRTQQVLYRQHNARPVDMRALGQALQTLNFGLVDAKQLASKNPETDFLTRLITEEMQDDQTDGLIFVGPKDPLNMDVPGSLIDRLRTFERPVFYLNYTPNPARYPWRDAIGRVVKKLNGFEYGISRPRDLFKAWSDLVSRIPNAPPR